MTDLHTPYAQAQAQTQTSSSPDLVESFVGHNARYYRTQFQRISSSAGLCLSFNWIAALLGPIWFGMRNRWPWGVPFIALESLAFILLSKGLWSDLSAAFETRIEQISKTLAFRHNQLDAAIASNADNIDVFERAIDSLQGAIAAIHLEATQAEATRIWLVVGGLLVLLIAKALQGALANWTLERRYSEWLSDQQDSARLSAGTIAASAGFTLSIYLVCVLQYSFPGSLDVLAAFPTDPEYRAVAAAGLKNGLADMANHGRIFFDSITFGIRMLLDALETLFVKTPWPVTGAFIILMSALTAGLRTAVFTAAALAYLGLLGFWDKSMATLALLGTAACFSIGLGVPFGILCARRPKLYAAVRPVLDLMQTMPAFVYLIPIIAFFGTGKPAAIIATMIFGGSPVVRLTVLGLRSVPDAVREAAVAFGATKRQLLLKVDLPLAAPSIMAGINQTIMLSLAMVVIASLIGAKGLGEDVLEALQYAAEGQGILAGFAILFCSMILDRIIQGRRK